MDLGALAHGEAVWIAVEGRSMAPTLRTGDHVLVSSLTAWPPEPGSVVLTLSGRGEFVMHRVVSWSWYGVTTCGDARRRSDPETPRRRVLGVAHRVRRDGAELPIGSARRAALMSLWERIGRLATSVPWGAPNRER